MSLENGGYLPCTDIKKATKRKMAKVLSKIGSLVRYHDTYSLNNMHDTTDNKN